MTTFNGEPWTLDQNDLLVSNGLVHDAILSELESAGVVQDTIVLTNAAS